ncbi:MAG: hypothetical protein IK130_06540 [Oscillospiraceae bacterium]|nr:hypothetical protein [Oscillospiraceae bacterium]
MNLTESEQTAVQFYEGDVRQEQSGDPFWGDPRAYCTLNALLFSGLRTERTRIKEGKQMNSAMLSDLPRLLELYGALFSAAKKGAQYHISAGYRVERAADFAVCREAGETLAFTSTCMSGFLPAYGDKHDIVLLTYRIPSHTPLVIFSQLLTSYLKSNEDELLLPPYLHFRCTERPLSEDDRNITDMNGNPPLGAFVLDILLQKQIPGTDAPEMLSAEQAEAGIRLFSQLNAGYPDDALHADDVTAYLAFKESLQAYLRNLSAMIYQ